MSNSKLKRIPIKFIFLGTALLLLIICFIISFVIQLNSVSIKNNIKEGLSLDECPDIEKAKDHKTGLLSSNEVTYASCQLEGLEVGLFAKTYYLPYQEKEDGDIESGYIEFYTGFKQESGKKVTVNSAKMALAEKWHNYTSSSTTAYSTSYGSEYLNKDIMTFYTSSRNITISNEQEFPKRYLFGMVNVKQPKMYVYVDYTIGKTNYKKIVEFSYDMFFIEGYTTTSK